MIRFILCLFCLISLVSWSQSDRTSVEFDSTEVQPEFVPLKLEGKWVWYDIANNRPSDSIYISDFAEVGSGAYNSFIVKDSTHWGMMTSWGDTLRPFIFDSIIQFGGHLLTLSEEEWNYHTWNIDYSDSIIPISFDSIYYTGNDLYYYDQGKTGLIRSGGSIIPANYDGIHAFQCTSGTSRDPFLMSLNGSEYNLINSDGEEVLPKDVWDLRCTEDGFFEFRRGEHPEFYLPYNKEIVSPNGRDIIFYSELGYKIYSEDKSRSELHIADQPVLKDQYDDYFLLGFDFIAVRKNGKVGLTRDGVQILGKIKYDQINLVSNSSYRYNFYDVAYFRYYIGDVCGLMDAQGNELFEAKYANVLQTIDDDRFIVLDKGVAGVVDRNGQTIIPIKYDIIRLVSGSKQFLVQNNGRIGLFDYNGKQRTPIEYDEYDILQTFTDGDYSDAVVALKKGKKYYFANSKGFIDNTGFDHFNHSNDVLKTYSSKAISVFLFDQRGGVEERSNYPIYRNAIIRRNYYDQLDDLADWGDSELEENQQEGYFGLRYYQHRGFGTPPIYRTIRSCSFNDYLGEIKPDKLSYQLTKEISAEVVRGFNLLRISTGKTSGINYFSSELTIMRYGSNNRYINRSASGRQDHANGAAIGSDALNFIEKVHYSDMIDSDDRYRRYFKGGEAVICPIDSSDVSLFEYYRYYNSLDGLRVTPEVMELVLNPKIGVRFEQSTCEVINSGVGFNDEKYRSFSTPTKFNQYSNVSASISHEVELGASMGRLRSNVLPNDDEKEVLVEDVLDVSFKDGASALTIGGYFQTKMKSNNLAKIHLEYPNYFFHQDSINLNYQSGRIIRRIDSNTVRLLTPEGRTIADNCIMIRYLNERRFGVLRANGWQLIDRNGKLITNDTYSGVSEFKNNRAEFRFADGSATEINTDGEELMPLPEPRTFLDEDHYFYASNRTKLINRFSSLSDQAKEGESYMSKGFFVSKSEGNTVVRRFGSAEQIELKSVSKVKSFGSCLYYQKGKHTHSVDSNLTITKFKKKDNFRRVTPEIGWLEGKNDQLIDANWNNIRQMKKDERFEMRDGDLIVFENDSIFTNYGSLKPEWIDSEEAKMPKVKVIYENGKYGVQQGQDTILPLNYSWLSKVNDQEFMTRIDSEMHLYDTKLERIGNRPFDRFIETVSGNFVFFCQDEIFVLLKDRKTYRLIQ
jgi:hypothetical protein